MCHTSTLVKMLRPEHGHTPQEPFASWVLFVHLGRSCLGSRRGGGWWEARRPDATLTLLLTDAFVLSENAGFEFSYA